MSVRTITEISITWANITGKALEYFLGSHRCINSNTDVTDVRSNNYIISYLN